MTASASPNRSPRAERTRTALITAGFDLLVERPIDGIPIDELVAKAGVGKGSFFNHFRDKRDFEASVANAIRREVESRVDAANAGVGAPLTRLMGGMRVAAQFAIDQPKRTAILLRNTLRATGSDHPLNTGLRADIEAARDQGLIRPETAETGTLYWLGLCQILMAALIEEEDGDRHGEALIQDMLMLGLAGLGVPRDRIQATIGDAARPGRDESS